MKKYILTTLVFIIALYSCKQNTKCCTAHPHPNFDCRSAWMKGVIFSGDTGNPVGYSDSSGEHYYSSYIEELHQNERDRKENGYKLDSVTNTYTWSYDDDIYQLDSIVGGKLYRSLKKVPRK